MSGSADEAFEPVHSVTSQPLVSVVTPAYEAAEFIEAAIRSVHAQHYRPMEHLVVDDGSPDSTSAIAHVLAAELGSVGYQVRVVELPSNGGAASALDIGLEMSRGEFVCWLSADDAYYSVDKTVQQVGILNANPEAAGTFDWITATGTTLQGARRVRARWPRFMEALPPLRRMNPVHGLIGLMFANPINGTSIMLRREWLESSGGFDTELGNFDADADLWMRIQALGGRLVGRRSCGTFYRVHRGQTSNDIPGMTRGTSLTRLRMIQSLADRGLLGPILDEVTDLLVLAQVSHAHHLRPLAPAALARLGLANASRRPARRALGRILNDLEERGLIDESQLAQYSLTASGLKGTPSFRTFSQALTDRGRGTGHSHGRQG